MADFPRYAIFRGKKVRILYYLGENRFRILQSDDSQRSVLRDSLRFLPEPLRPTSV